MMLMSHYPALAEGRCQLCLGVQGMTKDCQVSSEALLAGRAPSASESCFQKGLSLCCAAEAHYLYSTGVSVD